jgi:hypothetical protein
VAVPFMHRPVALGRIGHQVPFADGNRFRRHSRRRGHGLGWVLSECPDA